MYAVIDDNGRQFKVSEGDRIAVDVRDAAPGATLEFDKILFCGSESAVRVGTPHVAGVKVLGEVEGEFKGPKTTHYTFRRRKKSERKVGHRQRYLRVRITKIAAS